MRIKLQILISGVIAMPKKKLTAAQEAEKCAVLLQKLVRLKAADDQGYCSCVTCGIRQHWSGMQGGHFISRARSRTKLLVENVHPQCRQCNAFGMNGGNAAIEYTLYMQDMYGKEFVQELLTLSRQPLKWDRAQIADMSEQIKAEIKYQENRLGI